MAADPNQAPAVNDETMIEPGIPVIDSGETSAGSALPSVEAVRRPPSKRIASSISGKRYRKRDLVRLDALRPTLSDFIRRDCVGMISGGMNLIFCIPPDIRPSDLSQRVATVEIEPAA